MSTPATTSRPKSAAKNAPRARTPAVQALPTSAMHEIDLLLRPIAVHIGTLLRPIVDAWQWDSEFPGKHALQEADAVLLDLSKGPEFWAEEGLQRPLTGRMLENLHRYLLDALGQIDAATAFDPGQRRLLLLLVREAAAQYTAMSQAFGEACLDHRFGALRDLAKGAGGSPVTGDKFEVTASTPLVKAGKAGSDLTLWCSYDIEHLANELTLLGDEADFEGATGIGAKVRCLGARVRGLNSVIMYYLGGDDDLTIGEATTSYYAGAKSFKPQETTHA